MGTQWHFIHHKDLLEAIIVAWQKRYYYVCKKNDKVYLIRNSMEFYPSQKPNNRSTTTWQNPY
jgi:hypothetical protein